MKTNLCLGLLAFAALATAQPEQNTARQQATAFFAKLDASITAGTFSKSMGMFAKDYYNVDTEGKRMDLAAFSAAVKNWERSMKGVKSKTLIKNVQLQNQEMVVWTQQTIWWKGMKNGKSVPMMETTRWAEELRWTDGGWKFSSSQQLMTNEPWTFKTNG